MLGEIASAAKIAGAAAQGFAALQRLQPEYGKFWKKFESELKPEERDIPWDKLAMLRVDPEFVGSACGYIRGDRASRKKLRKRIVELAEPPVGGRYDQDEIVERVMRAADESAVAAAKDDRDVAAQRGRLLEARVDEMEENLSRQLSELQEAMAAIQPERPRRPGGGTRSALGDPHAALLESTRKLVRLLDQDPNVQVWGEQAKLRIGGFGYRPDFVVRDRNGVNWFVELKSDAWLDRPEMRRQAHEVANLVQTASQGLGHEWRFLLLTPVCVNTAESWSELLTHRPSLDARGPEPERGR
jgi:hypothetical protein